MGYDLVILLLCLYRLSSHQNSTLGNILLRDGIVSTALQCQQCAPLIDVT